MSQIRDGTCAIVQGTAKVIAATGVDWSGVIAGTSWFSPYNPPPAIPSPFVYSVAATRAPGISASGKWELDVVGVINDSNNATQQYAIQNDFTNHYGLAIPNSGDVQTAQIIARTFNELDGKGGAIIDGAVGARVYAAGAGNQGTDGGGAGVPASIIFGTERWDTDNCFTGTPAAPDSKLYCRTAGKYIISGTAAFQANATGFRQLRIDLNATTVIASDVRPAVQGGFITAITVTAVYDLAVGDYVQLTALQNSGAILEILRGAAYTPEFMMVLSRGVTSGGGGMVNPMTLAGDLIYGGPPTGGIAPPTRRAIGSAGQVLTVTGGVPQWAAPSGGLTNPMTTPADIIVGGIAGAPARLAVGAASQVLTVVAGAVQWQAPVSGGMTNPMTTVGDIIVGGASGGANRLGAGANGLVLGMVAGTPAWTTPASGADPGQTYDAPAAYTANATYAPNVITHRYKLRVTLNAGSGVYTVNFTLPVGSPRIAGDDVSILMTFAASVNPIAKIFNASTGGTLLWQFNNDGNANKAFAGFAYDGTAWYLERSGFIQ